LEFALQIENYLGFICLYAQLNCAVCICIYLCLLLMLINGHGNNLQLYHIPVRPQ